MRICKLDTTTALAFALSAAACNALVGLDDLSVASDGAGGSAGASSGSAGQSAEAGAAATSAEGGAGGERAAPVGECTTNQECTDKASQNAAETANSEGVVAAVCIKPEGRCAPL